MKALKKPLSLLMALLMCFGVFAGTGVTRYSWNLRHWQKLFADKDIHTMLDVISLPLYWKRDAVGRNGMVCCHGSEEKLIREMLTCKVHPQGNGWFCLGNNQ